MFDHPAISTLVLVATWFFARGTLVHLERRRLRAMGAGLMTRHLAHWCYAPGEWRRYCEWLRCGLWFDYLRPAARYAGPALLLASALAVILEQRSGLAPGLATAIIAANSLAIACVLIGPFVREFVRLSRCQWLEYEIYVGQAGVLEVWRQGHRIHAMEEHLYNIAGGAIRHVEANGAAPAEIVFHVGRPGFAGVIHVEEHFPVPEGHLAEAREIARLLTHRITSESRR